MKHILLVDDEPEVLEGQAIILRQLDGVVLHTADRAAHALHILDEQPVDLVLADIRMPGMNGIEMWEEIRRRKPDCRVIFLSGVRDFDHIYRIIQSPNARFLTKMEPEEKILATVEATLQEIDSEQRRRRERQAWLLHSYLTCSEAEREHHMARLLSEAGPLSIAQGVDCALFCLTHAWALSREERQNALDLLAAEAVQAAPAPAHYIRINDISMLWLMASRADDVSLEASYLKELCCRLHQREKLLFSCVYTKGLRSFPQLLENYQEMSEWMSAAVIPKVSVRSLTDIRTDRIDVSRERMQEIAFDMQLLKQHIKLAQAEQFRSVLLHMFERDQLRTEELYIYYHVLALLHHSLKSADAEDLRQQLRSEQVLAPETECKMTDRLLKYANEAFAALFPVDPYAHSEVVVAIQRYVHDHISDDLSLTALSGRFNMNPQYLSRLFRESTGHKLHEYITQMRMNAAEQLLRTTNTRVNDIAMQVGYDSAHTFIRSFRKQFSLTPNEYRARQTKETINE